MNEVKIIYENIVRKIRIMNFEGLLRIVDKFFGHKKKFNIYYIDDEDDLIYINSQDEFEISMDVFTKFNLPKKYYIFLSSQTNPKPLIQKTKHVDTQEKILTKKYKLKLLKLKNMGFNDIKKNLKLLKKYNKRLDIVIDKLLQ